MRLNSLSFAALIAALWSSGFGEELTFPRLVEGAPQPGQRVRVTTPEFAGTQVHHILYLPKDWSEAAVKAGKTWPLVVEYAGNYFPTSGSTGEVDGAGLGYGLSGGKFLWAVLPFVGLEGQSNARTWWGDEKATVAYAKTNVPRICETFGGDPDAVILCGFSRGAIAVNYIGLHDDEIAALWAGFFTHDHYDGVKVWNRTEWGAPLETYRAAARIRLQRIQGRPVLISNNNSVEATKRYLEESVSLTNFQFLAPGTKDILGPFPNQWAKHPHTDRWMLVPSDARDMVWKWVDEEFVE